MPRSRRPRADDINNYAGKHDALGEGDGEFDRLDTLMQLEPDLRSGHGHAQFGARSP